MAEHNGGNRGGNDRGPFRGTNNSGGEPRGFRSRDDRNSEGPKRPPVPVATTVSRSVVVVSGSLTATGEQALR